MFQQPGTTSGADAFGGNDIFDRNCHACQRTRIVAAPNRLVDAFRGGQRPLRRKMKVSIGRGILTGGVFQCLPCQFGCGEGFLSQTGLDVVDRHRAISHASILHRSITRGTL